MSGTDIAYGAGFLRAFYAMSGTERGYGATRRLGVEGEARDLLQQVLRAIVLRTCYAMSGTETGYRPPRCL
eukprot:3694421-Rhodomonas_salina.1